MNKYVTTTLVIVVLMVGLAEIYLALSWDEHIDKGKWNITFNWTLHEVPDSYSLPTWQRFFYSTQTSTKLPVNTSIPITLISKEAKTTEKEVTGDKVVAEAKNDYFELKEDSLSLDFNDKYDSNYPDCGFH